MSAFDPKRAALYPAELRAREQLGLFG
jgi:hypothetical protein